MGGILESLLGTKVSAHNRDAETTTRGRDANQQSPLLLLYQSPYPACDGPRRLEDALGDNFQFRGQPMNPPEEIV